MPRVPFLGGGFIVLLVVLRCIAAEPAIHIDVAHPAGAVSRYLTGSCLEDVNHEVYGGIYSQMLFGESFQEPPVVEPLRGFISTDGQWDLNDGVVEGSAGHGPKLVSDVPCGAGQAGVEVCLPSGAGGNGGLIVRVNKAGAGADNFDGYEVSIDIARKVASLGRHQHDYRLMGEAPCEIGPDRWIVLSAAMKDGTIEIFVDGKSVLKATDDHPLPAGMVGLRQWERPAKYRKLWVTPAGGAREEIPFKANPRGDAAVSAMWSLETTGSATARASIDSKSPFIGGQSQRLEFAGGAGEVALRNFGLNRWGIAVQKGKPYEGYVWARSEKPAEVFVSLGGRVGSGKWAEAKLSVSGEGWKRYDFTLVPDRSEADGGFAIALKAPGAVDLGEAFLQPGGWGRFHDLPVRRDVAEGLVGEGTTVMRYGGSMVNAQEYRWKKMTGPRDRRPPYKGAWYPYSTNGWGIIDFLNFCEAAGFVGIPAFNMDESPQDMADFMEYVNGSGKSEWGAKRVADGHPAPYGLRHIELGNEERVDEKYFARFQAIAAAIWEKDQQVIPVVGDFAYDQPIVDPMKLTGANSGITNMSAHRDILAFTKQKGRETWFDVHVWTSGPGYSPSYRALTSYVDALDKLADGAKHRAVVFELNSNNHDQQRALSNAQAILLAMNDSRIPVMTAANCLQPVGQNDNGWDQGLLFLDPSRVWLQPPGYVVQMLAQNRGDQRLKVETTGTSDLNISSAGSKDGKRVWVYAVNASGDATTATIELDGFSCRKETADVEELIGSMDAANTAAHPERIVPQRREWRHETNRGGTFTFAAHSFTIIGFQ